MSDDDFGRYIEPVARKLLGEPNARLSSRTELRFGTNGSKAIDLKNGCWYDHEAQAGGHQGNLVSSPPASRAMAMAAAPMLIGTRPPTLNVR